MARQSKKEAVRLEAGKIRRRKTSSKARKEPRRGPRIIIEADEALQQHLRVIASVAGFKSLREFILVELAVAYPELQEDVNRQYHYREFFDLGERPNFERIDDGY